MDQLAKLKNIPHQRKCNGCHEIFSSDVLGSDDKNKDFLCIHCNNDRYAIEEDTHEDCRVCKKLTWKSDLGTYPNGFVVCFFIEGIRSLVIRLSRQEKKKQASYCLS